MNTQITTTPRTLAEWVSDLNANSAREGWGGWDSVGNSVLEGVQNWSAKGDERTAIGVWGNVVEDEDFSDCIHCEGTGVVPCTLSDDDEFAVGGVDCPVCLGKCQVQRRSVNWCVYVGDCVDPQVSGLESAEDAMDRAERLFPEMF